MSHVSHCNALINMVSQYNGLREVTPHNSNALTYNANVFELSDYFLYHLFQIYNPKVCPQSAFKCLVWISEQIVMRRSWLRHCATSRKVAGSIPDGVTGIFHLYNPSGRTVALGSTQPLIEMSTRNIS